MNTKENFQEKTVYDCFIIGGGPAGMTAAIYAARACLKVAFIEKEFPGGKLVKTLSLENYPGYLGNKGPELANDMFKQVLQNDVKHYEGTVIDLKKVGKYWEIFTKSKIFQSKTVLICTGMKENVLNIPNEKKYYGRGVSYCAICDGTFYKGKKVIVVGGGNSAVEESIYLSDLASEVNLVHRREQFRAEELSVRKLKEKNNVKINIPFTPIEVKVENDSVVGLIVKNVNDEKEKFIEGECVFFYVGLVPEGNFLKNLNLEKNEQGFIKVDENMQTSIPSLYAAGDITEKKLRQIVTAINDGAIAAISIKNYINYEFDKQ